MPRHGTYPARKTTVSAVEYPHTEPSRPLFWRVTWRDLTCSFFPTATWSYRDMASLVNVDLGFRHGELVPNIVAGSNIVDFLTLDA